MPRKRSEPSREDLKKDEREIGANIPDEMVGLDSEDVGEVSRDHRGLDDEREKTLGE